MSNVSEARTHPTDQCVIATEVFTPGAAAHAAEAMRHRLGKIWLPLALPVAVLALIGMTDWRWLIVDAALLLTIYPFGVIAGWFGAMSSKSAIMAVYPQQITLTPDGTLTVSYRPLPPPDDAGRDAPHPAPAPIVLSVDMVSDCELRKNRIYLNFSRNSAIRRLVIPVSAFSSTDGCQMFCNSIIGALSRHETAKSAF